MSRIAIRALWTTLLIGTLGSCGGDDAALFLQPVTPVKFELAVNQPQAVSVKLSAPAPQETLVNITNPRPEEIETQPAEVVQFKQGDQQKDVTVIGSKATEGYIDITFAIRDSTAPSRSVSVKVQ